MRRFCCVSSRSTGFSLPELLVVLALIGIAIAIAVPLVNEQIRIADVRAAADDLAVHLRAARMMSVTKHAEIDFEVSVADNLFRYGIPPRGPLNPWREIKMPARVQIAPAPLIKFKDNGSVEVAGAIVLESQVSGSTERWTANVNAMGMPTLVHERVN